MRYFLSTEIIFKVLNDSNEEYPNEKYPNEEYTNEEYTNEK